MGAVSHKRACDDSGMKALTTIRRQQYPCLQPMPSVPPGRRHLRLDRRQRDARWRLDCCPNQQARPPGGGRCKLPLLAVLHRQAPIRKDMRSVYKTRQALSTGWTARTEHC